MAKDNFKKEKDILATKIIEVGGPFAYKDLMKKGLNELRELVKVGEVSDEDFIANFDPRNI